MVSKANSGRTGTLEVVLWIDLNQEIGVKKSSSSKNKHKNINKNIIKTSTYFFRSIVTRRSGPEGVR